jgi:hypothetical protein
MAMGHFRLGAALRHAISCVRSCGLSCPTRFIRAHHHGNLRAPPPGSSSPSAHSLAHLRMRTSAPSAHIRSHVRFNSQATGRAFLREAALGLVGKSPQWGSNPRPYTYEAYALPTEL